MSPVPTSVLSAGDAMAGDSTAAAPFARFDPPAGRPAATRPSRLRAAVTAATRPPEPETVAALLDAARLSPEQARDAHRLARRLATRLRERATAIASREGLVQGLIHEFSLSSAEGVALMCLAEAMLRIPDAPTRDALIRDKIGDGDWRSHFGHSDSPLVNVAAWGLHVTGRLVAPHEAAGAAGVLARLVARGGEPLIRAAVDRAMRLMGEQFVNGETIERALAGNRARPRFRHSYDMLGEAALTAADAEAYLQAYRHAIDAIGAAAAGRGPIDGPGVSVKLSALHPRYCRAQGGRVADELYPRLAALAAQARRHDIGFNIDAEEADRLELSLDLFERLCFEPALAGWGGLGFVVQAYQKRSLPVVDFLVDLARRSDHRLMVRLVKGAYWDSEIKRAQEAGLADYPVYTRKSHTDAAFLACARRLLAAPAEIYPQFATHNAHTLAAVHQLAKPARWQSGQYEFQCLHGMGEPLYEQVVAPEAEGGLDRPCRVYAPVGSHRTLLAYLVRRLLENGANTSFVNRIADRAIPIESLIADPLAQIEDETPRGGPAGGHHPAIPLPAALYGAARANSQGIDLADDARLADLGQALRATAARTWQAVPLVARGERDAPGDADADADLGADADMSADAGIGLRTSGGAGEATAVLNPADRRDIVGSVREASAADVAEALAAAVDAFPAWQATPAADRAATLERAADALQAALVPLVGLIVREAGRTAADAVGEVREAVDFLRYYAAQARRELAAGRTAPTAHEPGGDEAAPAPAALGPVVCISPWNFPLAIFTGQVAAALAAGCTVLAKPAEQTPLVAAEAVRLLHRAGVPRGALQLLPGAGASVGAALVADPRVRGVLFTGSTAVARTLQRALAGRLDAAGRPALLIAETGGINAMIADSSALAEQVVTDALASAFDSAGQRCSALRLLCVQEEVADRTIEMLKGAMDELRVGRPDRLATDVGPVIDDAARQAIETHVEALRAQGRRVHRAGPPVAANDDEGSDARHGSFVVPALVELDDARELTREVFGPVLHVVRWRRDGLGALLDAIDATGYALTLGLHTRLDETIESVVRRSRAGNVYVNRNMIGAVVGSQPFGGEGLSGTGPKAGGPLYLRRLLLQAPPARPAPPPGRADGRDATPAQPADGRTEALHPLRALRDWLAGPPGNGSAAAALVQACDALAAASPLLRSDVLPGVTGERNTWTLQPRRAVLCVAGGRDDLLLQLAHVLAAGGRALWLLDASTRRWADELPRGVRPQVQLVAEPALDAAAFDVALIRAAALQVATWSDRLARRPGPIVGLVAAAAGKADGAGAYPLERLLVERTLTVNTAAVGGNAALATLG